MTSTIPVFYDPAQVSRPGSFSPSAEKPQMLITRWQAMALPIEIAMPDRLTNNKLTLAHAARYVEGIFDLCIRNGFGGKDPLVAESVRWTTGSMLAAARSALASGRVAVSPTSGFHHAGHAFGGGFCTFNGLMIAALALRAEGHVRKVAILDCDEHYGNGTDDIIHALGLESFITHVTVDHGYTRKPKAFLERLPGLIAGFADCDLILYQAGADPHINDPLGGWLSTDELHERDCHVFSAARRLRIPIAWNLAGGYQEPIEKVLEIHDNTLRACIAEYLDAGEPTVPEDCSMGLESNLDAIT